MIPSLEAERAAGQLMRELADFRRRSEAEQTVRRGRLVANRIASGSMPLSYSAVSSMVAIAEGFFVETLRTSVESAFSVQTQLMQDAEAFAVKQIESTWPERLKRLKQWFGINHLAADDDPVAKLLIFVDARNAIAHGLGALTSRQLSNDGGKSTIKSLRSVGIELTDGVLFIDPLAVERCAMNCRKSILWLDLAAQSATAVPAKISLSN